MSGQRSGHCGCTSRAPLFPPGCPRPSSCMTAPPPRRLTGGAVLSAHMGEARLHPQTPHVLSDVPSAWSRTPRIQSTRTPRLRQSPSSLSRDESFRNSHSRSGVCLVGMGGTWGRARVQTPGSSFPASFCRGRVWKPMERAGGRGLLSLAIPSLSGPE